MVDIDLSESEYTEADLEAAGERSNFIIDIIEEDLASGKHDEIVTRFPPEPNGYLHIGHAKSVVFNYDIKQRYDGEFHLRFDDTNPLTEDEEYVESIKRDVAWLGADWGEHLYFASGYFERMYELAERLIKKGKAYVDSLDPEQIREYRGDWDEPGKESPYRDRPAEESLELFRKMRAGEFDEGEHVLRAKIDMAAENVLMRDPVLYRVIHADHHRTEGDWCIYPMYDYAHCLEDAFEEITHSLCTLEFENNRELYNWVVEETEVPHQPRQIEFARLNLGYTVMSKTKLGRLVDEGYVEGWDDPRMPTISGLRRRGVPPSAIRSFCREVGIAKNDNIVEIAQLEHAIRDDLEEKAPRVLCVDDPLKVVVEGFPEDETDWIEAPHYPENVPGDETRQLPFTRELYIDRDDFREDPPEDFWRLAPGREVRLKYGYFVTCEEVVRDDEGEVVELRCSYDPDTRGGAAPDGRSPKGTIHWVSAEHAVPCELRLYDRLFEVQDPTGHDEEYTEFVNDESLVVTDGWIEPSATERETGTRYQFERKGYYLVADEEPETGELAFNRIVTLRDTWADEEAERRKQQAEERAREKERRKERKKEEAERAREARRRVVLGEADPEEVEHYNAGPRDEARRATPLLSERARRYDEELGLALDDIDLLTGSVALSGLFEGVLDTAQASADRVAGWLRNDLLPRVDAGVGTDEFEDELEGLLSDVGSEQLAELVDLVEEGRITDEAADEVLDEMVVSGRDPEAIVERKGLEAITDEDRLGELVESAIEENPDQVEEYAAGNQNLFGFFMGQVMRATDGQGDPQKVRSLLQEGLPEPESDG
ncbi:MAG: glutamine--tRNA ligase/YqeY domain fusion protein [Bradymonadaceae bacterium]